MGYVYGEEYEVVKYTEIGSTSLGYYSSEAEANMVLIAYKMQNPDANIELVRRSKSSM